MDTSRENSPLFLDEYFSGCAKFRVRKKVNVSYMLILVIIIINVTFTLANQFNPYQILGVNRDASLDQIKKAYRELARKLHPDKSNLDENESSKRFIELNKAFDVLKDPEKRVRYDQFGDIEESRNSRAYYRDHDAYQNRQTREYYTHTNENGYRTFRFFSSSPDSYLRKKAISSRQYIEYVRKSYIKPSLVFFFSDFCPPCSAIESRWSKITEELSKFNVDSFSINVNYEPRLSSDLGITAIPHIACLIDGELKTYDTSDISLTGVIKFMRYLMPNNLVKLLVSDEDQDKFIALGPQSNKLSAIIIHNDITLKLRYLLLAHQFKQYYRFGHITTKSCRYKTISNKYNLTISKRGTVHRSLLVFDENIEKPILSLNFDQFESFNMEQVEKRLYRWPFLKLPKLSSQQKFDDLCLYTIPRNEYKTSAKLCVILFATDTPSSRIMRNKLIEFIEMNNFAHDDKVSFAYIDVNKQKSFIELLLEETGQTTYPFKSETEQRNQNNIESSIIMIERHQQNPRKALHRWLSYQWNPSKPDVLDKAKIELHDYIQEYRRNHNIIQAKVAITLLDDEDAPNLFYRVLWRFLDQILRTSHYITTRESFSTVAILVLCAIITSLFLYQLPTSNSSDDLRPNFMFGECEANNDREKHKSPGERRGEKRTDELNQASKEHELKIIELKAETYNGMVRLLKPGYRSIILLIDVETRDKLLVKFRKAVWPYRRNKTLLFGYLCLDKNLAWYKSLLEQVLDVTDLSVNKKNCIGTVLSLNGFKKYFRVYHAKHHEIDYYDNETENDGSFLGFNNDECDDPGDVERGLNDTNESLSNYSVERSLDKLPIWLDKMFDGLTKRYFFDNWPEEMN